MIDTDAFGLIIVGSEILDGRARDCHAENAREIRRINKDREEAV